MWNRCSIGNSRAVLSPAVKHQGIGDPGVPIPGFIALPLLGPLLPRCPIADSEAPRYNPTYLCLLQCPKTSLDHNISIWSKFWIVYLNQINTRYLYIQNIFLALEWYPMDPEAF
eukprot:gene26027-biopygen13070